MSDDHTAPPAATGPLVSAEELSVRLQTAAQHSGATPALLDVRWELGTGADPEGFARGHLPEAVFCDLEAVLTDGHSPDGSAGRNPLPAPASVRTWLEAHGITRDTPVVVMDGGHGAGAARAWWVLRDSGQEQVHVLDGGVAAWQRAGLPLEEGPGTDSREGGAAPEPEDLLLPGDGHATDEPHRLPLVDTPSLRRGLPADHVLLDARPAPRYRGEELGPDPVGGHVPGAVNLPVRDLHAEGRFLDEEDLRARFAEAGVDADTPLVLSCGSGITACQLAVAHRQAFPQAPEPTLYAASFSGWIADPANPLATGDEPGTMPA
ncbi:sulfurtransferase [Kytococcus sp. Marseille-QA3725]